MRNFLKLAIAGGFSFAILALMLKMFTTDLDPSQQPSILQTLKNIDTAYLWGYLLIFLIILFVRAFRYHILLNVSGEDNVPTLIQMLLVTGIRNMTVDLLPSRLGELSYVGLLNQGYDVRLENCVSSLVVAIAFDFLALIFIILAIVLSQLLTSNLEGWALGALGLAMTVSIIAFAMLFIVVPWMNKKMQTGWLGTITSHKWVHPLVELLNKFSDSLMMTKKAGVTTKVLGLSIIIRALKYFGFYLIFMAVAKPSFESLAVLPMEKVMMALIGGEVGASLPLPVLMSFGSYEAGTSLVFYLLGVADQAGALITMLCTHIVSQMYDYTCGTILLVIFIMFNRIHKKKLRKRASLALWLTAFVTFFTGSGLLALEYRAANKAGALNTAPSDIGENRRDLEAGAFNANNVAVGDLNGFVVWSSNRSGNHDIVKMTLPDMRITQLTTHPYTEYYPRVSPDGNRILFSRSKSPYVSQRNRVAWDLYLLDMQSGQETLISENATNGSWVNNDKIIYAQNGNSVIQKTLKSNETEVLFQSGQNNRMPPMALISTPDYNAQTNSVVFTGRQSDIGSNSGFWGTAIWQNNELFPVYNGCQIFWSSNKQRMFQVIPQGNQGNSFVYIDQQDYSISPMLDLEGEFSHEYFPKTSNDNTHLVFAASRSKGEHEHDQADYEIFLWPIDSDPGQAIRLTFHSGNDNWPDVYLQ
ncbi:MAG: hypothetical protein D6B25_00070 [Desulfobulbaceae bacterium]|nr:MAG: hypothetical protein D6B25_00070 [Desulfobulbaceae bacterium]